MSSHEHSHPAAHAAPRLSWSLLSAGAPSRLLVALLACGVLWGTIVWAL